MFTSKSDSAGMFQEKCGSWSVTCHPNRHTHTHTQTHIYIYMHKDMCTHTHLRPYTNRPTMVSAVSNCRLQSCQTGCWKEAIRSGDVLLMGCLTLDTHTHTHTHTEADFAPDKSRVVLNMRLPLGSEDCLSHTLRPGVQDMQRHAPH